MPCIKILEHLQLRTVIKESHGSPIDCVTFNNSNPLPFSSSANDDSIPSSLGNLFATVGGNQATVYDNSHMGRFVSICVNLSNESTGRQKAARASCAWVNTNGVSCHPHGEAWLAVAVSGTSNSVQVLSVVESRVIYILEGHREELVALSGASLPGLLLSLSSDGEIRLWDLRWGSSVHGLREGSRENDLVKLMPMELCFMALSSDAVVAELHPSGRYFVTGHRNGQLRLWILPIALGGPQGSENWGTVEASGPGPGPQCRPIQLVSSAESLTGFVESIVFLPNDRLAAKSSQGQVFIWHLHPEPDDGGESCTMSPLVCIKASASSGNQSSQGCRMSATRDGLYLCIGNASGSVAIYDTRTGARAALVEGLRVGSPVCSCAISDDCRCLLAVMGGFVFRFDNDD